MLRRMVVVALATVMLMPDMSLAQGTPVRREGFWFRAGAASGTANCSADRSACAPRASAPALSLQAGGAIRRNWLLGIDLEAWQHAVSVNGTRETHALGFLLADASWYPVAMRSWYVRAGLGTTTMSVKPTSGSQVQSLGAAIGAGTGYDFHVTDAISFTPYISYATALGASKDASANGARLRGRLLQVGAALSLY